MRGFWVRVGRECHRQLKIRAAAQEVSMGRLVEEWVESQRDAWRADMHPLNRPRREGEWVGDEIVEASDVPYLGSGGAHE